MEIKHLILGKADGNWRDGQRTPADLVRLNYEAKQRRLRYVTIPACGFTNRVAFRENSKPLEAPWLFRTAELADGIAVIFPHDAIAILNADCPVIAITNTGGILAVLHAGFRCLVPENPRERSIIDEAFLTTHANAQHARAFIGYGIGPCCFAAEDFPEVADKRNPRNLPLGRATRGPRARERSVDLYVLARSQLIEAGVAPSSITWDTRCTACDGRYHSHYWDGPGAGRNATLVWFE